MVQPPLANTNEDVAIFLIMGVTFNKSRENPIINADTPAISKNWIFFPGDLSDIRSLPHRTPQTVWAVVDTQFKLAHVLAFSTPSILLFTQAPRFSKFTHG